MGCWSIVRAAIFNADLGKEVALELVIQPAGTIRCLYSEELNLQQLGQLSIQRGSHVEPTANGQWTVDLSPVKGPLLGPFAQRSAALRAEQFWLEEH